MLSKSVAICTNSVRACQIDVSLICCCRRSSPGRVMRPQRVRPPALAAARRRHELVEQRFLFFFFFLYFLPIRCTFKYTIYDECRFQREFVRCAGKLFLMLKPLVIFRYESSVSVPSWLAGWCWPDDVM